MVWSVTQVSTKLAPYPIPRLSQTTVLTVNSPLSVSVMSQREQSASRSPFAFTVTKPEMPGGRWSELSLKINSNEANVEDLLTGFGSNKQDSVTDR